MMQSGTSKAVPSVATVWKLRPVAFNFQLSDWTLLRFSLDLQMKAVKLTDTTPPVETLAPPADALEPGSQGFCVRSMHVAGEQPALQQSGDYICYVALQYQHYYIDLQSTFEEYKKKFSSKTRSTIQRKVKKYAEHCGGTIPWKVYRTPEETRDFYRLARVVSAKTFQEKLLDAGLPDTGGFVGEMENLAGQNRVRAYILFDGERPVSYLYCPIHEGAVVYAYLGYDPEYIRMSVGTVLQWLALEHLFGERAFLLFDFTEGQSEHKRLFATHSIRCANVFFVRRTFRNRMLIRAHWQMARFSSWLGDLLRKVGLRARLRRLLRFRK